MLARKQAKEETEAAATECDPRARSQLSRVVIHLSGSESLNALPATGILAGWIKGGGQ